MSCDMHLAWDQKQEEGKPKASKESGRRRQRRAKRLTQLDLYRSREQFDTPEFWPGDIESTVFPMSWRGSDDASSSCSLPVSRKKSGRARQRMANAKRKHAVICELNARSWCVYAQQLSVLAAV
jgi:hypothetical protein